MNFQVHELFLFLMNLTRKGIKYLKKKIVLKWECIITKY